MAFKRLLPTSQFRRDVRRRLTFDDSRSSFPCSLKTGSGFRARRFRSTRPSDVSRTRGTAWTSETGIAKGLAYKTRRIGRTAWRRKLWNDTIAKAHYRSNGATSAITTTPVSATSLVTVQRGAIGVAGAAFWTAAGGATSLDAGTPVPIFQDDIILRGGKVGISFYNASTVAPLYIQCFLVRDMPREVLANIPLNPALGWDHTHVPEFFTDVAKYIMTQKEFTIQTNQVAQVEYRLKPMKIDQQDWVVDGQQLTWLIAITDYDGVAANAVRITTYHNVSFSADVVTPGT